MFGKSLCNVHKIVKDASNTTVKFPVRAWKEMGY